LCCIIFARENKRTVLKQRTKPFEQTNTIVSGIWQIANPDIRNIVLHQPLPNIKPQSALFREFLVDKTSHLLEIQS